MFYYWGIGFISKFSTIFNDDVGFSDILINNNNKVVTIWKVFCPKIIIVTVLFLDSSLVEDDDNKTILENVHKWV